MQQQQQLNYYFPQAQIYPADGTLAAQWGVPPDTHKPSPCKYQGQNLLQILRCNTYNGWPKMLGIIICGIVGEQTFHHLVKKLVVAC